MKKILFVLCIMILILSGCSQPQNTSNIPVETNTTESSEEYTVQTDSLNEDFYSVCTNFSKTEVEQFAEEVRELILTENWSALSERVVYPITMGGVAYEDKEAFINAPFGTLLNADAIASLQAEDCTDMFCRSSGIMMGNGEVWIGEVLNEDFTSAGLWVIALHILNPA